MMVRSRPLCVPEAHRIAFNRDKYQLHSQKPNSVSPLRAISPIDIPTAWVSIQEQAIPRIYIRLARQFNIQFDKII